MPPGFNAGGVFNTGLRLFQKWSLLGHTSVLIWSVHLVCVFDAGSSSSSSSTCSRNSSNSVHDHGSFIDSVVSVMCFLHGKLHLP